MPPPLPLLPIAPKLFEYKPLADPLPEKWPDGHAFESNKLLRPYCCGEYKWLELLLAAAE